VILSGMGFQGKTMAREETESRVIASGITLLRLPPADELVLNPRTATRLP
jgi:hypothetical protein